MENSSKFLQWCSVALLVTLLLFSPLISALIFICISYFCSFPLAASFALIYACWMFYDRRTDSQGGRWSDRIRRCSIWSCFAEYFPMTLIKTEDFDPKRNYIFGYHPHGQFSIGAVGNFATDATNFSNLFPDIRPHLMLLRLQFFFPFSRDLFLNLGACCVSRPSCDYLLNGSCGQGNALVIVLGGIREMKLTREKTMILYLRSRKGFVKLALKHGASLVPVLSFGENELYRQRRISWGRTILGHLPLRHPLVTVVGKSIDVDQINDPSASDIDQVHQQYLQAVEQLFNENKKKYGFDDVQLEII